MCADQARSAEEVRKLTTALCSQNYDLAEFRQWFRSGKNVPKEYQYEHDILKNLVGFPFTEDFLVQFDDFLLVLSRTPKSQWYKRFRLWFFMPISDGRFDGPFFQHGMDQIREKLKSRPWWKKLLMIYP
jgi:hypothetical protein